MPKKRMSRFPLARLGYLGPGAFLQKPEIEEHRYKALAAVTHLAGLGKLLRCIDLDVCLVCDDPGRLREIEEASEGLQTLGDLITIIADAAYGEIEEMTRICRRK